MRKGFAITMGRGFHITFENGYTVSVQFGPGNYCSNRDEDFTRAEQVAAKGSYTAETAVLDSKGNWIKLPTHLCEYDDVVQGYRTPKNVLDILTYVEALPKA